MIVCGIETSCDETSVAIFDSTTKKFISLVSSQVDIHSKFGGVVPEIASRNHAINIMPIFEEVLNRSNLSPKDIDLLGVTKSPGLIGALFVGVSFAKGVAYGLRKPLIGVNHLFAHILSAEVENEIDPPYLGVVISGGHTHIYLVDECYNCKLFAKTIDDAVGESFDKIAKFAGLPYPGGPIIEKLALDGDENKIDFPIAMKNDLNFSFSGLKTSVINAISSNNYNLNDIAASFQKVVVKTLALKINNIIKLTGVDKIVVTGGVACNDYIRRRLPSELGVKCYFPSKKLCIDNGDMIAYAAYKLYKKKKFLSNRDTALDNDDFIK